MANKAAMRRRMRWVFTGSGCLRLVITVPLDRNQFRLPSNNRVRGNFRGANSLLQISSFVLATGAPIGPLQKAWRPLSRGVYRLVDRKEKWLASSSSENPNRLTRVAQKRRLSHVDSEGHTLLRSVADATKHPEQLTTDAPSDDQLKPWERSGVSARFFEAFARTHLITLDMAQ